MKGPTNKFSIKNKMIISLAFHQIDFDWIQSYTQAVYCLYGMHQFIKLQQSSRSTISLVRCINTVRNFNFRGLSILRLKIVNHYTYAYMSINEKNLKNTCFF